MKLHLPKMLTAALFAAFISFTQASGTTINDAVLTLTDFTQDSITAANQAGWTLTNVTPSEDGIFTSATNQAYITKSTAWTVTSGSGSTARTPWSAILTINVNSLGDSGTGVLIECANNPQQAVGSRYEGIAYDASGNQTLKAAWNGGVWNNLIVTTDLKSYADEDGNVTVGIVYKDGNNGTTIFVGDGDTSVSNTGLRSGNACAGNPTIFLGDKAGVEYSSLYLFGGVVSDNDMKAMLSSLLHGSVTWTGANSAAWDTATQNWVETGTETPATFSQGAEVIFGTDAQEKSVTVDGTIKAGAMSVSDDYAFTVADGATLTLAGIDVASDKTATFTSQGTISLGTLSGAGKLALGENTQVSLGAISGTNTFSLADGSVLELAFSGLPATLTAEGTGTIRLLKGADQNTNLTTITAPILKLAADSSHNSRFVYNNSSNLSGVQNLYFDGAQLWLNSGTSALNFAGTVTFGTENHYSESANLDSAMRVNSSAKFSGAVDVQKDAKITWQAGNQSVEFAGAVTGSGNLTLATYNNGAQNGSKFIIGGDASQFAGALNVNHASITLEIKEGAKLNIGSGSDLKGAVSLNGELTVNGAAAISGNITGTGSIIKNGDGTLVLSGANNVLSHTIVVNAGYMTLSGGFEIGGIAPTGGETIYEGGQSNKNGYETATGNVVVYSGEGVDTTGGSFTYHGESVTLNNGAYTLRGEKDTTTFYINEGTESYSWIDEHKTEDFSNIVVKQAGTLQVNKDINMSLVSTESRGTVQIDSGYAATAAAGRNVTLTGAGTYVLEQSCVQGDQIVLPGTLGEGWTGTVQIHDVTTSATTQNNFTPLAKAGSIIELKGFNGLTNKWVSDQTENFKLTNSDDLGYAWRFSGATSSEGYTATFSGTWSGDGTMQTAGNNLNFKFSGNISDWDGKFQVASGAPDLTFSGNATEVNAVIDRNGKTLHLFVGDGSVFSTTFKADVNASDLTVNANASATLEADATIGSVTSNGHVEMAVDTTVTLSNNLTPLSGTVEVYGTLNVSHDIDLSSNGASTATLSLKGGSETTAAGMWMATGASLLLEEGAVLNIGGLEIAGMEGGSIATTAANEKYGTDKDVFSITNATVTSTGTNVTLGNTLSGVDVFVAEGSSLTLNTNADSVTVNAGGTINKGEGGSISNLTVENGGTIGEGIEATEAKIAKDATINVEESISDLDADVYVYSFVGDTTVTNVGNDAAKYEGLQDSNMKVSADTLYAANEDAYVVNNELVVGVITHEGAGALTLTKVDGETLEAVSTDSADLTIKGITETSLTDLSIGTGATVAVYTDDTAEVEGTVTITDTLTAGGGILLANLEMANSSTLDLSLMDGGMQALTLGSEFNLAEGALVTLDDQTLAAIASLVNIGDKVILINQYQDHELTTNLEDGDWSRTHFDLSSITNADYKLYVQDGQIGLVKSSNVPEPTTGTLSLLALMALAARRRRK